MSGRVLLIEDEPNIAEAIRFILSRDGWEVTVEENGAQALPRVADVKPDLVILDLMLPGMSGLEILSSLRADPATEALRVVRCFWPVRSIADAGCAMLRGCCRCWGCC
jgi:DNA-binding response OmpR family regulator